MRDINKHPWLASAPPPPPLPHPSTSPSSPLPPLRLLPNKTIWKSFRRIILLLYAKHLWYCWIFGWYWLFCLLSVRTLYIYIIYDNYYHHYDYYYSKRFVLCTKTGAKASFWNNHSLITATWLINGPCPLINQRWDHVNSVLNINSIV